MPRPMQLARGHVAAPGRHLAGEGHTVRHLANRLRWKARSELSFPITAGATTMIRQCLTGAFLLLLLAAQVAADEDPKGQSASGTSPAPEKIQQTVDRALGFLVTDSAKWRSERGCATCHHGAMTVWALSESRLRGYTVDAETLAGEVKWTKDLFVGQFSKPRDPRAGYNYVSIPGMYLATMSDTLPVLSRDEIGRVAVHLERHQETDGVWQVPPPNGNGSPPTFESTETLALWALLAWEPRTGSPEAAANGAARERAVAWLAQAKPTETTQSLALRLRLGVREDESPERLKTRVDQLLQRQNTDGGWSQVNDMPSDAYATGQVLWALSFVPAGNHQEAIGRAISFLVGTQQESGAWTMTARYHPDGDITKPRYMVPITYFGSAWATLGLVRLVPPVRDAETMQRLAFQSLRGISGSHTVDENAPGKPVVSIRVRYEVDDEQLEAIARLLPAFEQLRSLELKSPHITDAGAAQLAGLSQLHRLTLEDAAITDAGLAQLKNLANLEELNVKGTKVTDAGVADLCKVLPKLKVER